MDSGLDWPYTQGMSAPGLSLQWVDAIAQVPRDAWDALAVPQDNPFLEWDWLELLESSGCLGPTIGWTPHHLTLWDNGALVAAVPLYIKDHSDGEFVFDQPFAELSYRLGQPYYPKLVGMSPFTPTGSYRFLVDGSWALSGLARVVAATPAEVLERMIDAEVRRLGLSGCQFNYVDQAMGEQLGPRGYVPWVHHSFLWENRGFESFDDFLAIFKVGQRRNIRREREALVQAGVEVEVVEGDELTDDLMDVMYANYVKTNKKFGPWGCKHLSHAFFRNLPKRCGRHLAMAVAYKGNRSKPVATALLAHKQGKAYGRYWGGESIPFLHFEVCYYAPIAWCIRRGFASFDPGIGGEHKARRGFVGVPNLSLHKPVAPRLRSVMHHYLPAFNERQLDEMRELNAELPLREPYLPSR